MWRRCWRCGDPLPIVELLASLASGKSPQNHGCEPPPFGKPGAVKALICESGRLNTLMANVVFR